MLEGSVMFSVAIPASSPPYGNVWEQRVKGSNTKAGDAAG